MLHAGMLRAGVLRAGPVRFALSSNHEYIESRTPDTRSRDFPPGHDVGVWRARWRALGEA
ncbi:hypothetical protein LK459_16950 [Gordonia otitidis]|uniref:hypothetical protein n=1 Tax=Gordonia otitidis TaxID=249058 RepID=UPI001D15AD2B|nr:hypothetical protein [Gordonia otitidis]UEA58261.1 hypothetical protein LK459_16950 [Gordonia otitidis]